MAGSVISALASETRWRWPPDRVRPCSPITVAYPSGRLVMNSSASAALAAATICSMVASGRP